MRPVHIQGLSVEGGLRFANVTLFVIYLHVSVSAGPKLHNAAMVEGNLLGAAEIDFLVLMTVFFWHKLQSLRIDRKCSWDMGLNGFKCCAAARQCIQEKYIVHTPYLCTAGRQY